MFKRKDPEAKLKTLQNENKQLRAQLIHMSAELADASDVGAAQTQQLKALQAQLEERNGIIKTLHQQVEGLQSDMSMR